MNDVFIFGPPKKLIVLMNYTAFANAKQGNSGKIFAGSKICSAPLGRKSLFFKFLQGLR
jgi:hypothetical protein